MPTVNDVLAKSIANAQALLNRYAADLTPPEYLHRPCGGANCAAWLIGHLILTDRSAMKRVGVAAEALPPLPAGFEQQFARDETAPKAADYGDVTVLLPLFNRHREQLIEVTRGLDAAAIQKPLEKPHPLFATVWELLEFIGGTHAAMHAGQITMIRRSLGRPPLV